MLARFSTHLAEWYYMGSAVQTMIIFSHYGRYTTRTTIDIEQGANRDVLSPEKYRCIPSTQLTIMSLSRFSSSTFAHQLGASFANLQVPTTPFLVRILLDGT